MVVDTSIIIAILNGEPEREFFEDFVLRRNAVVTSAIVLVESELVMQGKRRLPDPGMIDALLRELRINVRPFDPEQARLAREAGRMYGKGRHRASLNFGDCLVYGLAKARADTLLFKGDDFALTDIVPAWRPGAAEQ